ncbi:hypothetical protein [Variovorax sp.]|nr:hypothetical protein [Variovorax sp.]HYP84482.1 hypothetical protein [Variovorax sp.]
MRLFFVGAVLFDERLKCPRRMPTDATEKDLAASGEKVEVVLSERQ